MRARPPFVSLSLRLLLCLLSVSCSSARRAASCAVGNVGALTAVCWRAVAATRRCAAVSWARLCCWHALVLGGGRRSSQPERGAGSRGGGRGGEEQKGQRSETPRESRESLERRASGLTNLFALTCKVAEANGLTLTGHARGEPRTDGTDGRAPGVYTKGGTHGHQKVEHGATESSPGR